MYLKWIGGKTAIVPELLSRFPSSFNTYIEPFIGSASVYFNYLLSKEQNLFGPSSALSYQISDANPFLVNCHSQVRDNVDQVLNKLKQLEDQHNASSDKKAFYLSIRPKVTDDSYMANAEHQQLAAYFIYVNKTCYNGLWRVNKKGKNNAAFNGVQKLAFDYELIRKASKLLKNGTLYLRQFDAIDNKEFDANTFVYMDPPYVPLNPTSNFTSYTSEGFGLKDLERLKALCERMDKAGAKWMLSNSNAQLVHDTFSKWNISEVMVRRFVSRITDKNTKRDKIAEVVITNY